MRTTVRLLLASTFTLTAPACVANELSPSTAGSDDTGDTGGQVEASTRNILSLAEANVNGTACDHDSLGERGFSTSCTGNDGQPEYWCADFVKWVWENNGVDSSALDAAAGSFYLYGQAHNTLSDTPAVGDAVVFNYDGNGYADHVAIVSSVAADGAIETISGDWGGRFGTEAEFSSTSSVVHNTPAYAHTVGSTPAIMGMTISGFIAPKGATGGAPPPPPPPANPCAGFNDGLYCGGDSITGDRNTLYQCSDGKVSVNEVCAHSCQYNPGGENDICGCEGLNNGLYCGGDSDVGGARNTLYSCDDGTLNVSQVCSEGCIYESGDINDTCK